MAITNQTINSLSNSEGTCIKKLYTVTHFSNSNPGEGDNEVIGVKINGVILTFPFDGLDYNSTNADILKSQIENLLNNQLVQYTSVNVTLALNPEQQSEITVEGLVDPSFFVVNGYQTPYGVRSYEFVENYEFRTVTETSTPTSNALATTICNTEDVALSIAGRIKQLIDNKKTYNNNFTVILQNTTTPYKISSNTVHSYSLFVKKGSATIHEPGYDPNDPFSVLYGITYPVDEGYFTTVEADSLISGEVTVTPANTSSIILIKTLN